MFQSTGKLFPLLIGTFLCAAAQAEELKCDWHGDRRVAIVNGWIEAQQGRDENAERLRIAIWGPGRIPARCEQLDNDPESEVVVVSRGAGTGPYYRLQILDFRRDGITTWSYPSHGLPKIEYGNVLLGKFATGFGGAGSIPDYSEYRFTDNGLVDMSAETNWILFMSVTIDGTEIHLPPTDQRSPDTCEIVARNLVEQFLGIGQQATFSCQSNLDIRNALEQISR